MLGELLIRGKNVGACKIIQLVSHNDKNCNNKFKDFCTNNNKEKILAVGDNIRTDILGANNMKFDSLFITNGIHKNEFLNLSAENYDKVLEKYKARTNYYQEKLVW